MWYTYLSKESEEKKVLKKKKEKETMNQWSDGIKAMGDIDTRVTADTLYFSPSPPTTRVKVKIVVDAGGRMPSQGFQYDVGNDIYTMEDALILPEAIGATIVKTGMHTSFDASQFGLFATPRSSMAKMPLSLANSVGVIEGTYTGDIGVPLKNNLSHTANMWSPFALTWDEETKKVVRIDVDKIPTGILREAKERYIEQHNLLFDIEIPEQLEDQIFVEVVPHGSFFVPKGTRLLQVFLLPRYDIDWHKVDSLEETERGSGGFGSTGHA